jgi:hypothetical protein
MITAVKRLLEGHKSPLTAGQIADYLVEGGFDFKSETPANSVASTLSRADDPEIVKTQRGQWQHKKWDGEPTGEGGWSQERLNLLKMMWKEGKSAAEIAHLLGRGVSRNAVIGKAHRMGLPVRHFVSKEKEDE